MVVVEAAAEADGACGVLVVIEGDDDGRVSVEAGVLLSSEVERMVTEFSEEVVGYFT